MMPERPSSFCEGGFDREPNPPRITPQYRIHLFRYADTGEQDHVHVLQCQSIRTRRCRRAGELERSLESADPQRILDLWRIVSLRSSVVVGSAASLMGNCRRSSFDFRIAAAT